MAADLISVFVCVCVCVTAGEVEHFQSPFEGSVVTAQSISISFYQGLFAYNGWLVIAATSRVLLL